MKGATNELQERHKQMRMGGAIVARGLVDRPVTDWGLAHGRASVWGIPRAMAVFFQNTTEEIDACTLMT